MSDNSIYLALEQWTKAIISADIDYHAQPEIVEVTDDILLTTIGNEILDKPEKLLRVHHLEGGFINLETEGHLFTNVYLVEASLFEREVPTDPISEPVIVNLKLEYSNW